MQFVIIFFSWNSWLFSGNSDIPLVTTPVTWEDSGSKFTLSLSKGRRSSRTTCGELVDPSEIFLLPASYFLLPTFYFFLPTAYGSFKFATCGEQKLAPSVVEGPALSFRLSLSKSCRRSSRIPIRRDELVEPLEILFPSRPLRFLCELCGKSFFSQLAQWILYSRNGLRFFLLVLGASIAVLAWNLTFS